MSSRSIALWPAPLLAAVAWVAAAQAQISPGPLARPHAQLEGSEHCLDCHAGRSAALDANCLACHREIRWLVDHGRGLHGTSGREQCAGCHPDHAGKDFEMIEWKGGSPEGFDHAEAGWPLAGAHARVACRECHTPEHHAGPLPGLWQRAAPAKSWLGLDGAACASCHEDTHRGALGQSCGDCHDATAWKPAPGFDHARTAYPLTGKHATTPCAKCHLVPGRDTRPRYEPLPHAECSDCHEDVHRGRLGPACAACHVTTAFAAIDPARFDHSRTRYPLRGKHSTVQCARCHLPASREPLEYATCSACHRDAHAGTATRAGNAVDCASCHDERGFDRSTYTSADHALARYPLAGRHASVACRECHVKDPSDRSLGTAGVRLRRAFARCRDCHTDPHAAQLAARADGGACESCHTVQAWRPSSYGGNEHAALRLGLEGKHAAAECADCHGPDRRGLPALPRLTFAIDPACASCHHDPHRGRFPRCADCHGFESFRPSLVDATRHDRFAYRLEGAHRAVACAECHRGLLAEPPRIVLLRVEGPPRQLGCEEAHQRCEDCHRTPHGNQFDGRAGGCAACHGLQAFRPAERFDHVGAARFRLDGAHRNVPCERCHARPQEAGGVVVYRPMPLDCRDCHGPDRRFSGGAQ